MIDLGRNFYWDKDVDKTLKTGKKTLKMKKSKSKKKL